MKSFASRLFAAAAALLALTPLPAAADALIDHVNGITLDREGRVVHFAALLIGADGKVTRLLQSGDARPPRVDWHVDMHGKTLIPGFFDAHGHVMDLGFRQLQLDLSDTRSFDQARAKIAAYAAHAGGQRWIMGGGWNQELWKLGRFPTAAELDAITGDRPTILERIDGHSVWVNSAVMREAGITARTVAPAGGQIIRNAQGQPTGIFIDAARELIERVRPAPLARDRDSAFYAAQKALLSVGVTAISDMRTTLPDWLTFRRAGDINSLHIRITSYADGIETANLAAGAGPSPWLYADLLRMGGVKVFADGALGSRGAWLKAPYADAPTLRGTPFHRDDEIRNIMARAAMDHFQVAVHAIGDAANAQVLGAIEDLAATYKDDRRWRIEHAQIVDPADLPRFGHNGIIASMQPVHATSDRQMAEARLGPARLAGAYAWAAMLKNGAHLAFGSDTPNDDYNPFDGWAAAFTRQDANGEPFGGWLPEQRVSREAAWKAYTVDAAYAAFAEDRYGTLAPGLRADFVIIDRDPLLASPSDLRATVVEQTWVGGQKVYERK